MLREQFLACECAATAPAKETATFFGGTRLFTGGGTEANNLALAGAATIVTSRLEHPSVTRVAEAKERAGGVVRWLPVTSEGTLDFLAVDAALADVPRPVVVAVSAVNHEGASCSRFRK